MKALVWVLFLFGSFVGQAKDLILEIRPEIYFSGSPTLFESLTQKSQKMVLNDLEAIQVFRRPVPIGRSAQFSEDQWSAYLAALKRAHKEIAPFRFRVQTSQFYPVHQSVQLEIGKAVQSLCRDCSEVAFLPLSYPPVQTQHGDEFEIRNPSKWTYPITRLTLVQKEGASGQLRTFPFEVLILAKRDVLRLRQTILAGQRTIQESFQRSEEWINPFSQLWPLQKNAMGLEAKRTMRPGHFLLTTDLHSQPVVVAGQMVQIHYKRGGLSIKSLAQARSSGDLGELIQVVDPKTRKVSQARVVGALEVEL